MSDTLVRFRIRRAQSAADFLERAEPFLLEAEAENNLILGVAARLRRTGAHHANIYFATVEQGRRIVGCAFRTPPYKLGLTRIPAAALDALGDDVASCFDDVNAVLGPAETALAFAERWCAKTGQVMREGMRQRIYQLDRLEPPESLPPGVIRKAGPADRDLITTWVQAFSAEAGTQLQDPEKHVDDWIRRGVAFLWDDHGPRSMAGRSGETPNGARIGFVYTPPESAAAATHPPVPPP